MPELLVFLLAPLALLGLHFSPLLALNWALDGEVLGRFRDRPATLYLYSVMALLIILTGCLVILWLSVSVFSPLFLLWIYLSVMGMGFWTIHLVHPLWRPGGPKPSRKSIPLPQLQFWLQDALVALLAYGAVMALMAGGLPAGDPRTPVVAALAVYVLAAQGFGLYVALDVFRRPQAPRSPRWRAGCLALVLFLATACLPLAWLAWRAWRRAIWLAAWEASLAAGGASLPATP